MEIIFGDNTYHFVPWKPALGCVFTGRIAFDCETTLIDEDRPWLTPSFVLGAAFDGNHGVFVTRQNLAAFFEAHPESQLIFHNAPFDLDVIATALGDKTVYDRVEANKVADTQLMHRLLTLGEAGHTSQRKGESTLEHCAEMYLDTVLPKDITDSVGDPVRLSYGKWLTRPLSEIEPIYLVYLAADVIATRGLFRVLSDRTKALITGSEETWGYVSEEWLRDCIKRFGPQTHHIQLRAAIVLRAITANGLHLDTARREELKVGLEAQVTKLKDRLRKFGYLPGGKGADKSLQAVLSRRARKNRHLSYPLTEGGMYATAHDAIIDLADTDPFISLLLEYRETTKLLGSFVGKMAKPVLHPSFNVLARSGRTSSFGEINAQNLPKSDAVRTCFVPRSDHVLLDADYSMIELVTLAQACVTQFGLESKMATAINNGDDLHKLVAGRVLGKPPDEVTKAERQKAKPVNFGKPGGMGAQTLTAYAKFNYGVSLTLEEAEALSESWFDLFPEMREFLGDKSDVAAELAALLGLTPESHFTITDDPRFIDHPENAGREDEPHPILGAMLLKVMKESNPTTRDGKPYSARDCDYFWSALEPIVDRLPKAQRKAVAARRPSRALQRAVMGLVGRAPVFTLSGRVRADATYSARHNTIFQGLAADGAKLALWLLWRAGYRIVNFVHDQVVIEVPAKSNLKKHAERIRELMIQGMKMVVPDVLVEVKYAATDRWYKDAEAIFKDDQLMLWHPKPKEKQIAITS